MALVTTGLQRGGAESQVVALAEGLRRRGWTVEVVSLLPPTDFVRRLEQAGVAVTAFDLRSLVGLLRAPLAWAAVVRRFKPDVVHSHMVHANLFVRLLRPFVHVPRLICTAHSTFEGGAFRERLYRWTDRWSDCTTQVSRHGVARYAAIDAVPSGRLRYVPNGIVMAPPRPTLDVPRVRRPDSFTWIAVGRLVEPKDYPTLLRAFALLRKRRADARLLIVGEGPLRAALEALHGELCLGGSVTFLGQREDVGALLAEADALVLSSAWEGLPLVLLEAGRAALPVVATEVGGLPEVIEDEVSGRLVPPGEPVRLAGALEHVMTLDDAARAAMGRALQRRVTNEFDLERVLDIWERLYRRGGA